MKLQFVKGLAVVAGIAGTASPAVAQHDVKSGIDAWQRGDYAAAVAIWRPLAQKGNADAEFDLGQAYRLGRGVQVDLAQAQLWLEQAAEAGHLDAQTTLGLLLFDSGNRTGAMRWLKRAAQRGEPRAMLVYGTALFNGDGVPKDPLTAYAYVSRAAAQGLQPAKETLADMDQVLPIDVRQKALAMAMDQAKVAPAPSSVPAKAAPKTKARAAPKPAPAEKIAAAPVAKAPARTAEAAPLAKAPPKTAEVAPKPSAPPASGGWRIQLGAFSERGSAEGLYRKLAGSLGGHQAYYVPAGKVTRLQVGPYPSRNAASAACASLHGQACFPVAAK
jgi:cell division septation protein DedD